MNFIREPAVAGAWYPDSKDSLRGMVDDFIENATLPEDLHGSLIGLIAPHAGYVYSGWVAGYSFKYVKENYKSLKGKTAIIMGPSHRVPLRGISIIPNGGFKTPLGIVPIDSELSQLLIDKFGNLFSVDPELQAQEHSIESEVPFLQSALGKDFKIVPLMFGSISLNDALMVGKALGKIVEEEKAFLVTSSDMSHYHPYKIAESMDSLTISTLEALDIEAFADGVNNRTMEMCGYLPVFTLMEAARECGAKSGRLLKYANSGDVPYGEKDRVVGYCSVLYLTEEGKSEEKEEKAEESFALSDAQRVYLLKLARRTIEDYVTTGKLPNESEPKDKALTRQGAAFVTLRTKEGHLRGCIGQMIAMEPLWHSVMDMAASAATRDYRFPSVSVSELDNISIEISVLSPLKRIDDWRKIRLGEDGVYIKKGMRSGVFLPQVGRDPHFTLESFLRELCVQKAGLPPDAYKDPSAELYIFTVEEFDEKEMKLR